MVFNGLNTGVFFLQDGWSLMGKVLVCGLTRWVVFNGLNTGVFFLQDGWSLMGKVPVCGLTRWVVFNGLSTDVFFLQDGWSLMGKVLVCGLTRWVVFNEPSTVLSFSQKVTFFKLQMELAVIPQLNWIPDQRAWNLLSNQEMIAVAVRRKTKVWTGQTRVENELEVGTKLEEREDGY